MKKILLILFATIVVHCSYAQNTNPWPSTGNVGIGTTSPSNPLDISTSGATPLTVQRTTASSNVGIEFKNQTASWFAGQASNGNFSFNNAASLNSGNFQISPAGYIGLGTTAPTHSITLSNNSTGIAVYRSIDQTTNYERLRQYYNGHDFTFASEKGGSGVTRDIKFTIGTSSSFTLSAGGAPLTNAAYEVSRGTIGNATSLKSIFAATGALGSALMQNGIAIVPIITQTGAGGYRGLFISPFESAVGSGKKYLIDAGTNSDVYGSATHTSKFTVDNTGNGYFDGNVGIGTTIPDAKLTVNGTIHSIEIKVNLNIPGPDYVFEPGYKLTTLSEIKTYINKNHHLPEIPSADQMAKEGINLSEMNMKLLKKVEELTLHLIEKENQLTQQQEKNKQQDARIAALEKLLKPTAK